MDETSEFCEAYLRLLRERLTALRLEKGMSEYRLSYELGLSKGYIHNIASGKALPSMRQFFEICGCLETDPALFFMCGGAYPPCLQQLVRCLKETEPEMIEQLLALFL